MKFLFSLFLFITLSLNAQVIDKRSYYDYGNKFFTSFLIEPIAGKDSSKITFLFKISNSALSFNQNNYDGDKNNTFSAFPLVESSLTDETGIIRQRTFWKDTVEIDDFEKTKKKFSYVYGYNIFVLADGKYNVKVKLLDKFSKKLDEIKFNITAGFNSKNLSSVFFTSNLAESNLAPFILNNQIHFNSYSTKAFLFSSNDDKFSYRCQKTEDDKFNWKKDIDFTGRIKNLNNNSFRVQHNKITQKPILKTTQNSTRYNLLEFDLPGEQFVPGKYKLTLRNDNTGDTSISYFKVVWEDKPLSLQNIDYGVKSMYYVMTEKEHDNLEDGSNNEKFNKIIKYWKEKDPTPNTPYNEAMAEYFKRVDYAAFNYRTLKERDGAQTDRGKIHILYGKPTDMNKILKDDKTIEKWYYKNIDTTFIFEMVSNGVYKLIKKKEGKS